MKSINWNNSKNLWLKANRNIGFEEILFYIDHDFLVDDIKHPNSKRYPNQRIFVVDIEGYIYLVPYVESDEEIFLKTIIPSRKATRNSLGEKMTDNLTNEERDLLESFEKGEWESVQNLNQRKKAVKQAARQTLRKDESINIRITEHDLRELQRQALQQGLPWQAFIAGILHKFVCGNLREEPVKSTE